MAYDHGVCCSRQVPVVASAGEGESHHSGPLWSKLKQLLGVAVGLLIDFDKAYKLEREGRDLGVAPQTSSLAISSA